MPQLRLDPKQIDHTCDELQDMIDRLHADVHATAERLRSGADAGGIEIDYGDEEVPTNLSDPEDIMMSTVAFIMCHLIKEETKPKHFTTILTRMMGMLGLDGRAVAVKPGQEVIVKGKSESEEGGIIFGD